MRKPLPYDAVIFDLDGTLTCSENGILTSLRYAFTQLGIPEIPDEQLRRFIGPPLRESFMSIAGLSQEMADQAIRHYVTYYDAKGMYLYSIYPLIRPLLATLKKQGAYLGVATSKPISRTLRLFSHFRMDHYFNCIVGEDNNDAHIGKAELIRRALPETCRKAVMVGDRKFDIEGAKANGIDSIGAGYGYGPEGELEAAMPTHIVDTTQALYDLLCPDCEPLRGYF
ncbi:MAG TPA: HAD hydrolase-like protein, partial [Candidatus Limiplasma sp.]|nr:HAD hydrolase-like protein [Candidatus Limiplasma sp.]